MCNSAKDKIQDCMDLTLNCLRHILHQITELVSFTDKDSHKDKTQTLTYASMHTSHWNYQQ